MTDDQRSAALYGVAYRINLKFFGEEVARRQLLSRVSPASAERVIAEAETEEDIKSPVSVIAEPGS